MCGPRPHVRRLTPCSPLPAPSKQRVRAPPAAQAFASLHPPAAAARPRLPTSAAVCSPHTWSADEKLGVGGGAHVALAPASQSPALSDTCWWGLLFPPLAVATQMPISGFLPRLSAALISLCDRRAAPVSFQERCGCRESTAQQCQGGREPGMEAKNRHPCSDRKWTKETTLPTSTA